MLVPLPNSNGEFVEYLDIHSAERECPDLAKRIYRECDRVGGFVPYEQGYVYAIQAVGTSYYKLGKTINPDRRLLQIAPQMPFPTRFVKVWRTNFMSLAETWLHSHFAERRANGEWFDLDHETAKWFFYDLNFEYDEQIKHVYGYYFFESVVRAVAESESIPGIPHPGFWGGSAISIAWIESLFEDISREQFSLADDIRAGYYSETIESIKALRGESNG